MVCISSAFRFGPAGNRRHPHCVAPQDWYAIPRCWLIYGLFRRDSFVSGLLRRVCRGHRPLNDGELLQRCAIFRADRPLGFASGVCPLECINHGNCDWNTLATMGRITDQIPLRKSADVAGEAITTEAVDDFHKSALSYRRSVGGYIKLEELPVVRSSVKALLPLYHHLGRHELEYRACGVNSAGRRFSHLDRALEVPNQIVHIEMADVCHLRHATKRFFADRGGWRPDVGWSSHRRANQQRTG